MAFKKRRWIYFVLFLLIIPVGLATRKQPPLFYPFITEYGGDVLWSTMFFFLFRLLRPGSRLRLIALYTWVFSVAIEISQLYHSGWIDKIRETFLGRMLLGNTFLWSDMLCYFAGAILGWLMATMADKYADG